MPSVECDRCNNLPWSALQKGIQRIMTHLPNGISQAEYMRLYSAAYTLCTPHVCPKTTATYSSWMSVNQPHAIGEELYGYLSGYLRSHVQYVLRNGPKQSDEELLTYYSREWSGYVAAATVVNKVFRYFNCHWVKWEIEEGKKDVYNVYGLHLVTWYQVMFDNTRDTVISAVLRLVERSRDGDAVDYCCIKNIADSFVALGFDDEDTRNERESEVYREYFEKPFIDHTAHYYLAESERLLACHPVVEYMRRAEARLDEEVSRGTLFLHEDTYAALVEICNTTLIARHQATLQDEFQKLLHDDQIEDLRRAYRLLRRVPGAIEPLRRCLSEHIADAGRARLEKAYTTGGDNIGPETYVGALLAVRRQYAGFIVDTFGAESDLEPSLDRACRDYVNRNVVCNKATVGSPELFARYADRLLRWSSYSGHEHDLEDRLTQFATISQYLEDKDTLQKFLTRNLARRLLSAATFDQAEFRMVSKLGDVCGPEYANKIQRMVQDKQSSPDLNRSFRVHLQRLELGWEECGVDATYQTVGAGYWPIQAPTTNFTPPRIIAQTCGRFDEWYTRSHSNRKLVWPWQLCKGEIWANYTGSASKAPCIFQVSAYQMAILLMYNETSGACITYHDITATTALARDILDPSLAILVEARVISPLPDGANPRSGTVYELNTGFQSAQAKVDLNIALAKKAVRDDRRLIIQSAIVRIMKSRKRMQYRTLLQETMRQVGGRNAPKVADVKRCVEMLVEKEYVERLEEGELGYLA